MGLAVLAVLRLLVWLATPADMYRHRGRGGFSGAKQPQGSAKEGTSLCQVVCVFLLHSVLVYE